jgi:hypothetical protein
MSRPTDPARRSGRPLLAALACGLLLSCSDDLLPPPGPAAATALEVASRDPHPGIAGQRLPDSVVVRATDAQGRGVADAIVGFSVTAGGGAISPAMASTDAEGYARAVWTLGAAGEQAAAARVDGPAPVQLRGRIVPVPATAAPMLGMLGDYMASAVGTLNDLLPRNPNSAQYIQAKLAVLRTRGLGGEIVEGRRFEEGRVASRGGASLPVTAVFPVEAMRPEARRSIDFAASAVPVLEDFLGTPFPLPVVRIWHGFILGNSGGGGTLYMEDRATYEARTPATRLPYDAILVHELAHSYLGSESLTQFLELYGYNVLRTGSADVGAWTFTRDYVPGRDSNEGVHALLDVYRLIGRDAMAAAYRAVLPLHPPYGQPLSAAARQAFVDAAPPAAKAEVAARVAKVLT